jgi:hypothetical protein
MLKRTLGYMKLLPHYKVGVWEFWDALRTADYIQRAVDKFYVRGAKAWGDPLLAVHSRCAPCALILRHDAGTSQVHNTHEY